MKRDIFFAAIMAILLVVSGCSKPKGHLVGIYSRTKSETAPYGMVFVPRGSFNMGVNDQSVTWAMQPNQRTISIDAFWMDQTEITNGEYRQFVQWVRDSIVRTKLARMSDEEESGKYFREVTYYNLEGPETDTVLNWKTKVPWKQKYSEEDEVANEKFEAVQQMFFYGADKVHSKQANSHIYIYKYKYVNYDQGAIQGNEFNPYTNGYNPQAVVRVDSAWVTEEGRIQDTVIIKPLRVRSDLVSTRIINIYPDTMVWMRDFSYSYNEPMMHNYFAHPGFGEFPVVGISWDQANAFCYWRTELHKNAGLPRAQEYRLPNEGEWEYAARGGRHDAMYPWGGPYVRDERGCFLANFKPMRGNYTEDGYLYPCKVGNYNPNDYGLYDMAGNVSEWTFTTFDSELNNFTRDFNPNYDYRAKRIDPALMKRKVIKGGSWKDVGAYLQCGMRDYEYQNRRRASIGFRCVRSYIGN
jgi:gliding motility-associated lipoprotein GldK